jgi:PLD-like domain
MTFLVGQALQDKVRYVLGGNDVKCAVAFWGTGAEKYFEFADPEKKVQIICNLNMGGTNPKVIRSLMKNHSITQSDVLHAKVYVSDLGAVIGSANMSINGLGIEGLSLSKWEEAAFFTQDAAIVNEIVFWFDKFHSHEIKSEDLDRAQKIFNGRKSADYSGKFPIICWWGIDPEISVNSKEMESNTKKSRSSEEWFKYGMNFNSNDSMYLYKYRSRVFLFYIDERDHDDDMEYFDVKSISSGVVDSKEAPDFVFGSKLKKVKSAEQKFLAELIYSDKYRNLRDSDYSGNYIIDRLQIMSSFWGEFKQKFPDSELLKQSISIKGQLNG